LAGQASEETCPRNDCHEPSAPVLQQRELLPDAPCAPNQAEAQSSPTLPFGRSLEVLPAHPLTATEAAADEWNVRDLTPLDSVRSFTAPEAQPSLGELRRPRGVRAKTFREGCGACR